MGIFQKIQEIQQLAAAAGTTYYSSIFLSLIYTLSFGLPLSLFSHSFLPLVGMCIKI